MWARTSAGSFLSRLLEAVRAQPTPAAGLFGPVSPGGSGCRQPPPAAASPPLAFPTRPRAGSWRGPASPRSLPAAGVYVIRGESLQIPPLCVIWAARSILPPAARSNNGKPRGLPVTLVGGGRNSGAHWRGYAVPQRNQITQIDLLAGLLFSALNACYTCSSFAHSLHSV